MTLSPTFVSFARARVLLMVVAVVVAGAPAVLDAQTGALRGTVSDQISKQPLEGARVVIVGTPYGANTKADGTFYISAPYGTYSLEVSASGYSTADVPNMTVSDNSGSGTGKVVELVRRAGARSPATQMLDEQGRAELETRSVLPVKTFPLQNLTPSAAALLVGPYVQSSGGGSGVFEAGPTISAITVRAPSQVLGTVDSILRVYDRVPATLTLHFKLIVATDSVVRSDNSITEIDATLRQMFRFGGYRQIAEGTTTITERSRFNMNLTSGGTDYYLSGDLGPMSGSGSNQSQQLTINLYGAASSPNAMQLGGGRGPAPGSRSIMSTGLTVPIGQTVVIGGATGNDAGRTLILTVRPELTAKR